MLAISVLSFVFLLLHDESFNKLSHAVLSFQCFSCRWGMKPIDLARNSRHSDVIILLENHKKKKDLVRIKPYAVSGDIDA